MLFVLRNFGGPVEWYARDDDGPQVPDAAPTVQILNSEGGEMVAAGTAATRDADTVVGVVPAGAPKDGLSCVVDDPTGYAAGKRYVFTDTGEEVRLLKLSGTTLYFDAPLWDAHAAGAALASHRLSYTMSAAESGTESRDYCRALFSWDLATVAQVPGQVEFALTRYYPRCPITTVDLHAFDENLRNKLPLNARIKEIIKEAWDAFLEDVSAAGAWAYDYVGSERARSPVIYNTLRLCAERYGREKERDFYATAYRDALQVFGQIAPVDVNRDGAIEREEEGAFDTYRVERG